MKQHYTTLGLQEGASLEEIEAAYKRLSKDLDPANNDNQEFFKEEYKKLQVLKKASLQPSRLACAISVQAELQITYVPRVCPDGSPILGVGCVCSFTRKRRWTTKTRCRRGVEVGTWSGALSVAASRL